MTVAEYRRLLGLLLLWALVPFPFLYIILPPFWLLTAAIGLFLVLRPTMRLRLSVGALNAMGIAIVVVVAVTGGLRVGPLRPLGHLLLLLTSVRALLVVDRRTFLRALLPVFLVWVVALTSSTDVSVVFYFGVSAAVWWWTGMRIHLSGLVDGGLRIAKDLPRRRHVVAATAVTLLLSIPIFLALPRLRSPWVAGRGGLSSVTGFSSHVDLAGVGSIRQSHEVAIIVRSVAGDPLQPQWMRLRATALERMTRDSWAARGATRIPEYQDGLIWPHGKHWSLEDAVELEVEVVRPRRYLFQPEGTIALSPPVEVRLDPSGGVVLAYRVSSALTYRVWVTRGPPPRPNDPPVRGQARIETNPEVRQLALDIIAGVETEVAQAAAVERYLQENYDYSMSGMTHMRTDPVAWFLFDSRQGHCEYFAGAMVALLDAVGIPARMVAGYSGGSLSRSGEEALVRQANAHTWVEARVGHGERWTAFDPTPAGEVPPLNRPTGTDHIRWTLEWVQSSWDRYVLTFGLGEQIQLIRAVADAIDFIFLGVTRRHLFWVLAAVALGVLLWWSVPKWPVMSSGALGRARRAPAAAALGRVARRLEKCGVEVPPSATVRWIANRSRGLWPGAAAAVTELAWLAERELYAGEKRHLYNRAKIRNLWTRARHAMRQ
jgi:transglutaminase-like putative cysteine protease